MTLFHGGCLCGAMRYETTSEPLKQRVCHCRACQKVIGAAFNALVLMRNRAVSKIGLVAMSCRATSTQKEALHGC